MLQIFKERITEVWDKIIVVCIYKRKHRSVKKKKKNLNHLFENNLSFLTKTVLPEIPLLDILQVFQIYGWEKKKKKKKKTSELILSEHAPVFSA